MAGLCVVRSVAAAATQRCTTRSGLSPALGPASVLLGRRLGGLAPAGSCGSRGVVKLRSVAEVAVAAEHLEASSSGHDNGNEAPTKRLIFLAGSELRPRADKVAKGGEDACFIADAALGVADGVGGYNEQGVDPGEYAKELMRSAARIVAAAGPGAHLHPRDVMQSAWMSVRLPGACTSVVCTLNTPARLLRVASLGDSGLRVYRAGRVVFATKQQQHYFDCPYQMSDPQQPGKTDSPQDAALADVPVAPGDVVLLGSDGVFDNVPEGELTAAMAALGAQAEGVGVHPERTRRNATAAAEGIAALAQKHSLDPAFDSPYMAEARAQGMELPWFEKVVLRKTPLGGKPDDITAVVGIIAFDHAE